MFTASSHFATWTGTKFNIFEKVSEYITLETEYKYIQGESRKIPFCFRTRDLHFLRTPNPDATYLDATQNYKRVLLCSGYGNVHCCRKVRTSQMDPPCSKIKDRIKARDSSVKFVTLQKPTRHYWRFERTLSWKHSDLHCMRRLFNRDHYIRKEFMGKTELITSVKFVKFWGVNLANTLFRRFFKKILYEPCIV